MKNFTGIIIKESLDDESLLDDLKVISTKVELVKEKHKTPWIKQWTLCNVEIEPGQIDYIAECISKSLDINHKNSWYADFKNENTHYIIFRDKVFKIDRTKAEEYNKATEYGISVGIPDYQLDFSESIKKEIDKS